MQQRPHEIEQLSYKLLEKDLQRDYPQILTLPPLSRAVIKRVVHSTGDPSLSIDMVLTESDLDEGLSALQNGATVITDVQMTTSGIGGLSGQTRLSSPTNRSNRVIGAIELGTPPLHDKTRSYTGMMAAIKSVQTPYIVVIGCSPTAVFAVLDAVHKEGLPRPALTIATPVGYVDAVESKERLAASGLPVVINKSARGGAAVAAAAFNALRYHPRHPGDEQ